MKKFIIIFACLSVMFSQVGCPSKSAKNEDEESVASEEAPESDTAAAEDESTEEVAATEEQTTDSSTSEQMSETQVSNDTQQNGGDAFTPPPTEAAPADYQAATPPVPEPPPVVEPPPAMIESPTPVVEAEPVSSEPMPVVEKPKALPLLKVDAVPRKENGVNLNTVYVARSGDSLKTISQKIYSADKVSELKANNPGIKNKPSIGTKIYYQSPNRPDDETKVLTYYEDVGMTPEVYVAQSGDDLKKVAKKVLGSKDAWKELWVTNSFESKGKLDEGTEIRYWKSPEDIAKNQNASPDLGTTGALPEPPAMPDQANQLPPPPDMAKNDFPPPPPVDNNMPPPPPPSDAMAPPPPPPPMEQAKKLKNDEPSEDQAVAMDEDTMLALGAVGVSAAALAALIVIRRKRKMKETESEFHSNAG